LDLKRNCFAVKIVSVRGYSLLEKDALSPFKTGIVLIRGLMGFIKVVSRKLLMLVLGFIKFKVNQIASGATADLVNQPTDSYSKQEASFILI
jgi:hypothetical protein